MARTLNNSHRIEIDAPVDRCFRFFTPRGETLWVDGWSPNYLAPSDGRTCAGMVFTTGRGDEHTVWMLADFEVERHRARYVRLTPALRTAFVEVRCTAITPTRSAVEVRYTLTALNDAGAASLAAYEGERFVAMIEEWRERIAARLPELLVAEID
jgi:hypothetical protein